MKAPIVFINYIILNVNRPDSEEAIIPEELYQNFTSELSLQLDKTSESADEKFTSMLRHRKTWMIKKEVLTTFKVGLF